MLLNDVFILNAIVIDFRFEKQDGVVLMATTRNPKQIDDGLKRPGRMDRVFHLQPPTQIERERILHIAAKKTMDEDLIDFVDWRKVMLALGYRNLAYSNDYLVY